MVMELHLSLADDDADNNDERMTYAKYLIDHIKNMLDILNRKKRNVKYSAYSISVARFTFLRNKKSYDELLTSGLLCLLPR